MKLYACLKKLFGKQFKNVVNVKLCIVHASIENVKKKKNINETILFQK